METLTKLIKDGWKVLFQSFNEKEVEEEIKHFVLYDPMSLYETKIVKPKSKNETYVLLVRKK